MRREKKKGKKGSKTVIPALLLGNAGIQPVQAEALRKKGKSPGHSNRMWVSGCFHVVFTGIT